MISLLQTALADSLNVEEKITEVIETVKNTPTDVLLADLLDKIVIFGLKVLAALFLYTIGVWLIRKIKRVLERIFERKKTDPAISSFVQSIASISLTIILIISIVGTLGIDTTSLAALLAGGGMAIGMALNGTVQNFAGGIMILIFRPFKAGDYIEAHGFGGTVSEVNITSTKLTTVDNRVIIIPNGILSNDTINNFSQNTMRRLDITIDVEYGTSATFFKYCSIGISPKSTNSSASDCINSSVISSLRFLSQNVDGRAGIVTGFNPYCSIRGLYFSRSALA